jgi:hypothetical protein
MSRLNEILLAGRVFAQDQCTDDGKEQTSELKQGRVNERIAIDMSR